MTTLIHLEFGSQIPWWALFTLRGPRHGVTVFPASLVVRMVAFQGGSEGRRREKCLVTNFKMQQFFKKITNNNNKRQQKVPLAPTVEETAGQTEERASTSLNNLWSGAKWWGVGEEVLAQPLTSAPNPRWPNLSVIPAMLKVKSNFSRLNQPASQPWPRNIHFFLRQLSFFLAMNLSWDSWAAPLARLCSACGAWARAKLGDPAPAPHLMGRLKQPCKELLCAALKLAACGAVWWANKDRASWRGKAQHQEGMAWEKHFHHFSELRCTPVQEASVQQRPLVSGLTL